MACIFFQTLSQAQKKKNMLQIVVSSKGESPVESATVRITNTSSKVATLITSVEFEGQMPEDEGIRASKELLMRLGKELS